MAASRYFEAGKTSLQSFLHGPHCFSSTAKAATTSQLLSKSISSQLNQNAPSFSVLDRQHLPNSLNSKAMLNLHVLFPYTLSPRCTGVDGFAVSANRSPLEARGGPIKIDDDRFDEIDDDDDDDEDDQDFHDDTDSDMDYSFDERRDDDDEHDDHKELKRHRKFN